MKTLFTSKTQRIDLKKQKTEDKFGGKLLEG